MKKLFKTVAGICAAALCVLPAGNKPVTDKAYATDKISNSRNLTDGTAIAELYNRGIVDGFENGKLYGENNLTRAQFAKILINAFPDVAYHEIEFEFSDFDENHWSYEYVQKAVNAGWLKGYDDGTFRPDVNITYEQALTVVCRILGISWEWETYPYGFVSDAIDNSITDKVNALIGDELTREQVARIILNAFEYSEGELEEYDYGTVNSAPNMVYAPTGSTSGSGGGGGSTGGYPSSKSATADMEESFAMPEASYGYGSVKIVEESGVYGEFNTEEYTASDENIFKNTLTSPLSTFSIDTDTASYSNLRRFILNGQNIANGSVRSEELINYFDYSKADTEEGQPFGVNYTVAPCPWNENNLVAMLTVSGEELKEAKPSNLVFLIDTSGSMYSRNKLPLVKQALSMLLDKLGENDTISIVTYASGTGVALEPTPATEKEKIIGVINGLRAAGGTYGASGINLAYEQAEKFKIDGNNRIILCTDGDFNIGISSTGDLEKLIEEKRRSGIFLSVLGFGMGNYKDNRMETLADKGNGNYAYIDNLREAKKVLVDEMSKTIYTIAKDVKLQVEFNPSKVKEYRLIGYENRLLSNEDFANDAKDAGELGAGATVTVLYEIVPGNAGTDSSLKYQTSEIKESDELMTVNIRYKLPDGDESILTQYPIGSEVAETTSDDFRFACAVAELGMILNDSEFKGSSNLDSVITLAKDALGEDKFGIRSEFVQLVDLLRYRGND